MSSDATHVLSPKDSILCRNFGATLYWQYRCAKRTAADTILTGFRNRIKQFSGTAVHGTLMSEAEHLLRRCEDPVRAKNFFPSAQLRTLRREGIPRLMARGDLRDIAPWLRQELESDLVAIARANEVRASERFKSSLAGMGSRNRRSSKRKKSRRPKPALAH